MDGGGVNLDEQQISHQCIAFMDRSVVVDPDQAPPVTACRPQA